MRKTMMATLVVMLVLMAVTPELRAAEKVIDFWCPAGSASSRSTGRRSRWKPDVQSCAGTS